MRDGDFELDGTLYGSSHGVMVESVTPGAPEFRDQDAFNPVGDNRYFGRDYVSPPSWELGLWTAGSTAADARAALGSLASVWNRPLRSPGAEQVLRYQVDGKVRRLYGRCRGLSFDPNRTFGQGKIPATATFVTRDQFTYDDTERSSGKIRLLPAPSGGVTLPATLPFTLSKAVPRAGLIPEVGGDAPAPVQVVVHGPLTGKWSVTVGGHRLQMTHSLAYDRSVLIDTRTLAVRGDDGSNLSGKLSRSVFLPDVRLNPGPSDVVFEGNDISGTSWAEVTWHPAYYGF